MTERFVLSARQVFLVVWISRPSNYRSSGPKSFVDDLCTSGGVILGRAATTLRSIKTRPLWLKDLSCRLDMSFLLCGFPLFFFLFTFCTFLNCNFAKKLTDFYITPAMSKISVGICLNISKAETHRDIATLLLGRRSVRATIVFGLYPRVGFLTWSRSVCAFPDHPIIRVLVPNCL